MIARSSNVAIASPGRAMATSTAGMIHRHQDGVMDQWQLGEERIRKADKNGWFDPFLSDFLVFFMLKGTSFLKERQLRGCYSCEAACCGC